MPGPEVGQHSALDPAYYEDLAGRLYGLLIGLEDRLDRHDAQQLDHFIEVGEYGLALEEIAGTLAHAQVPIAGNVRCGGGGPMETAGSDKWDGGLHGLQEFAHDIGGGGVFLVQDLHVPGRGGEVAVAETVADPLQVDALVDQP